MTETEVSREAAKGAKHNLLPFFAPFAASRDTDRISAQAKRTPSPNAKAVRIKGGQKPPKRRPQPT